MKKGIHYITQITIIMICVFFFRTFLFGTITVKGSSMEPNFHHGDFVIVNKLSYHIGTPQKGDVVICRLDSGNRNENIIKRIIALPGDEVDMKLKEDGWDWEYVLYINGEEQHENNISFGPYEVPEDSYFVMGDNRNASTDSREASVGAIPKENIKGKVFFRLYPFENIGIIKNTKER